MHITAVRAVEDDMAGTTSADLARVAETSWTQLSHNNGLVALLADVDIVTGTYE